MTLTEVTLGESKEKTRYWLFFNLNYPTVLYQEITMTDSDSSHQTTQQRNNWYNTPRLNI